MKTLPKAPVVRVLINIIIGVILFQLLFGLVFNGSAAGAVESLVIVVIKLLKLILVLGLLAGILLLLKKVFPWRGEEKMVNFERDKVVKGVVIALLAIVAIGLLGNLFNGSGSYTGPGYYGHGGGEGGVPYGYGGGSSLSGLISDILSLLITLMSIVLVAALAIGAYKVAWPQLNAEIANFIKSSPKIGCPKCGKELASGWQICPYCGTPVSIGEEPVKPNNLEISPAADGKPEDNFPQPSGNSNKKNK